MLQKPFLQGSFAANAPMAGVDRPYCDPLYNY